MLAELDAGGVGAVDVVGVLGAGGAVDLLGGLGGGDTRLLERFLDLRLAEGIEVTLVILDGAEDEGTELEAHPVEIDVRLQEHNRYEEIALYASTAAKFVLYSLLLLAAIYWGVKGDFVDFWDAFLWLVAFVFIDLNVFEWRAEENAARSAIGH